MAKRTALDEVVEAGLVLGALWLGIEILKSLSRPVCPNCKTQVAQGTTICPNCGRLLI